MEYCFVKSLKSYFRSENECTDSSDLMTTYYIDSFLIAEFFGVSRTVKIVFQIDSGGNIEYLTNDLRNPASITK
jgi:hypothetical protein